MGRQFSLWVALPVFDGVLAAVEIVREELPFPAFKIFFIKVYKQERVSGSSVLNFLY